MFLRQFVPPEIEPSTWEQLSPLGRILVEAGAYLTTTDILLPNLLYVEHLLAKVNLEDNRHPGHTHKRDEVLRMELKLFIQFLQRSDSGAYSQRVVEAAEARNMRLSRDEDGASLYKRSQRARERRGMLPS